MRLMVFMTSKPRKTTPMMSQAVQSQSGQSTVCDTLGAECSAKP